MRWISSTNSTSRGSSAVRIAAMSFFSTAGRRSCGGRRRAPRGRCTRATSCRGPAGPRAARGRAPRRAPSLRRARSRAAPSRAPARRTRRASAGAASARRASSSSSSSTGATNELPCCLPEACRTRSSGVADDPSRERPLGVVERVAELDERVARDDVAVAAGRRDATAAASFSFSSSTMRSAVFLPMPGIAWKRAVSSRTIARRSSSAGEPETIASATFGPTPFTERSWMNSSRSARSAKPYS